MKPKSPTENFVPPYINIMYYTMVCIRNCAKYHKFASYFLLFWLLLFSESTDPDSH
jgi:hypothetical protein